MKKNSIYAQFKLDDTIDVSVLGGFLSSVHVRLHCEEVEKKQFQNALLKLHDQSPKHCIFTLAILLDNRNYQCINNHPVTIGTHVKPKYHKYEDP